MVGLTLPVTHFCFLLVDMSDGVWTFVYNLIMYIQLEVQGILAGCRMTVIEFISLIAYVPCFFIKYSGGQVFQ